MFFTLIYATLSWGEIMSVIRFFDASDSALQITEFGRSQPSKPRKVGPWVRNTFLLHYVVKGICRFEGIDIPAGTAFLIIKDQRHTFEVTPPYEHYWFAFDGELAREMLAKQQIPFDTHRILQVAHPPFAEHLLKEAFLAANLENGAVAANSALMALISLISATPVESKVEAVSRIQEAATYMETQYSHHITMEDVAAHIHLSEKYVCKRFKELYGMPPQQYLTNVRMRRAAHLLINTDLQISEIATSVGFASPLYFSNAFRRFFGVSPSAYKSKKNRNP